VHIPQSVKSRAARSNKLKAEKHRGRRNALTARGLLHIKPQTSHKTEEERKQIRRGRERRGKRWGAHNWEKRNGARCQSFVAEEQRTSQRGHVAREDGGLEAEVVDSSRRALRRRELREAVESTRRSSRGSTRWHSRDSEKGTEGFYGSPFKGRGSAPARYSLHRHEWDKARLAKIGKLGGES